MSKESIQIMNDLINGIVSGSLSVRDFCAEYEETFNFRTKKSEIPAEYASIYSDLFEKVIYFSPYKEDVENTPIYFDAGQIREAAELASRQLGLSCSDGRSDGRVE